jgi:NADPH:quinone reductase-like Zn-dependent oxidoreductase
MLALHVPAAGDQPRLADVPIPEVADGSVLIRVKAAGLNAIDTLIAAGMIAEMLPHEYPVVLGRDAAGVVEAVGAGVDHVGVGDEVFGNVLLAPPIQHGTLAQFALLPAGGVARKPAELDFITAAAIPLAGAAATAAVEAVDPRAGQVVLINGATGGVGSFAVQLLAARGVTVVATGSPADADRLSRLGATTVVDHTAGSIVEQIRAAHPDGVDGLVELVARSGAASPLAAVKAGGKVASTTGGQFDEAALSAAGLTLTSVLATPVSHVIGSLADAAATGELTVDVGTVLHLDRAAEGLATLAAGNARGKIVITTED